MKVLGIIPARGGSRGIPRKNLVMLAGRPLLSFTIQAAKDSTLLSRTILSTEDSEIGAFARSHGIEVPFVRPGELATDTATALAVAQHALTFVEREEESRYDLACLLQPTCPLRVPADIDTAIDMLHRSDADSVVSVAQVEEPHPVKMMLVSNGYLRPLFPRQWQESLRRQELSPTYYLNGAIYCVRRSVLLENNSLWGKRALAYIMPRERSINVDSLVDLDVAASIIRNRSSRTS